MRRYTIQKLKPRLNSGKDKMYEAIPPDHPKDRHVSVISESQIDYDGLADLFFCSLQTIKIFYSKGIIKEIKKVKNKKVFDKESTVRSLNPYVLNGRLSLSKISENKYIVRRDVRQERNDSLLGELKASEIF